MELEFIGTPTGGRWFNRDLFKGTLYCFGVGEDISFELAAADAGMDVFCFDPTPRSWQYMQTISHPRVHLIRNGLGAFCGRRTFYYPANRDEVSCSMANLQHTEESFEAFVIDLSMALKSVEFNQNRAFPMDILKIDIEGTEYEVIRWMLLNKFFPPVFMVEFHPNEEPWSLIAELRNYYSKVYMDNNDYLFIKD